jgi:hypothetical protein
MRNIERERASEDGEGNCARGVRSAGAGTLVLRGAFVHPRRRSSVSQGGIKQQEGEAKNSLGYAELLLHERMLPHTVLPLPLTILIVVAWHPRGFASEKLPSFWSRIC